MWRKFTVYGLRFSKTSFWNRMNTGFLDPAVATVLTACGIETVRTAIERSTDVNVATVLTACGIETYSPFAATHKALFVATVLTACGIETNKSDFYYCLWVLDRLQQCLPLAVLKL